MKKYVVTIGYSTKIMFDKAEDAAKMWTMLQNCQFGDDKYNSSSDWYITDENANIDIKQFEYLTPDEHKAVLEQKAAKEAAELFNGN